ncbi:MAG: serine/threonine protein kinase [Actinomycetales bacterium]|nr:serine/threonine protein kinase [Actinomycetales bacterium]
MDGFTKVADLGGGIHYDVSLAHDHHRRALVVVKALRPDFLEDPSARAGYLRELELLSRISHPNIVRLLAYDDEAAQPFLVLEYLDGPTLSKLIATDGHLEMHQFVSLAVELTSAIAYLHDEGFAHLDVKPSNIIMGAPAKLIDLSLAMPLADAAALDHPVGTDEYMAPEQCLPGSNPGQRGLIGPASDVWAIGASLFRAVGGHRAWPQGGHPQLNTPPRDLPEFVPPVIRDIIGQTLQTDPAARPSPDELLEQFEGLIDHLPKARLAGFKVRL